MGKQGFQGVCLFLLWLYLGCAFVFVDSAEKADLLIREFHQKFIFEGVSFRNKVLMCSSKKA